MGERGRRGAGVARIFMEQPERLTAAWRRVRCAEAGKNGLPPHNQLETAIEPFIRELGRRLAGEEDKPWSRTQAVLRLSPGRGPRALHEEFAALRRCLLDAVDALDGGDVERRRMSQALDEAVDSAVALLERMITPEASPPRVPFGGVVVRLFERPAVTKPRRIAGSERTAVH